MHQDPIDTCPYDVVHRIARSRMPFHLLRCRQNWPCSKKKQCPFDARHLVSAIEYSYHINTCSSRETVMHYKMQNDQELQSILPIETKTVVSTCENWDDEPEVRSYDPEKNILNRPIVRTTIGLSKSKRRQFKMSERRRIQELDANNERQEKVAAQVPQPDDNEYKPLRRPKKLLSDTLNSSALSLNSSNISEAGEKSTQQKNPLSESQAKANTSVNLDVINEHQENIHGKAQNTNNNANQFKQLRRPKMTPVDTLNMSTLSLNCSVSSIVSDKSTVQKNPTFTNASALSNSSKSTQKTDTPVPNALPFSYAAALSKNSSKNSDDFDVIVEEEPYDNEKENTINNSFLNRNENDSIIEKISKTVEGLDMDDAAHKKKTELLNKEIEKLKTLKKNSEPNTDKKFLKCAANFPVLK